MRKFALFLNKAFRLFLCASLVLWTVTACCANLAFSNVSSAEAAAVCLDVLDTSSVSSDDSDDEAQTTQNDSETDSSDTKTDKTESVSKESKKHKVDKKKKGSARSRRKARMLAKADKLASKLSKLALNLELASEDLGLINDDIVSEKRAVKKSLKKIAKTENALKKAQKKVNICAHEIYVNGKTRLLSVLLGAISFDDFASRLYLYEAITSQWQAAVDDASALDDELHKENEELEGNLERLSTLKKQARKKGNLIADNLDKQLSCFAKLKRPLAKLVNKKIEIYLKRYRDSYKDANSAALSWFAGLDGSWDKKDGAHARIVKIARKFLGVKYVWGGDSPRGFDCSGLTMYCYAKIGIMLTHYARTQYSEGKHIARSALMPGDLVFFGPSIAGIHHVGIYIGGDRFLHAPHTGDVVKISKLSSRSDCVGACRPSK